MGWIDLAHERTGSGASLDAVVNFRFPHSMGNFLGS
jgi:hypothetical protein